MTLQVAGTYQAKDVLLQKYLIKVKELAKDFKQFEVKHVPRDQNVKADILSKSASIKPGSNNRSLIQETLKYPSIGEQLPIFHIVTTPSWAALIIKYLKDGTLPSDIREAKKLVYEATNFALINSVLYKRGISQPLLKCLVPTQVKYVLEEVYEGSCSQYLGIRSFALKVLRAGYY